MNKIKPMTKIMIVLCIFGISMGMIFPIYAGLFIQWVPGKRLPFVLGCLIAGFIVGMFGYVMICLILKRIDNYSKNILANKLGTSAFNRRKIKKDLLLNMKEEFEELLNQFVTMKRNEENQLKELSITDCLTSLYNHRYFHESIQTKIAKGSQAIHILFCDIDNFKMINDLYGHVVGDLVLKEVASEIRSIIKQDGSVYRYGGEEFVVLLENCTLDLATQIAEKMRLKVSSSKVLNNYNREASITISIGIASYPEHTGDLEDLLNMADKAMYDAKTNGRNQCKIYRISHAS